MVTVRELFSSFLGCPQFHEQLNCHKGKEIKQVEKLKFWCVHKGFCISESLQRLQEERTLMLAIIKEKILFMYY